MVKIWDKPGLPAGETAIFKNCRLKNILLYQDLARCLADRCANQNPSTALCGHWPQCADLGREGGLRKPKLNLLLALSRASRVVIVASAAFLPIKINSRPTKLTKPKGETKKWNHRNRSKPTTNSKRNHSQLHQ
jgi:hypothetical protein